MIRICNTSVILYAVYTLFLSPAKENIGRHFEYSSSGGYVKWNGVDFWDDCYVIGIGVDELYILRGILKNLKAE